MGYTLKNPTGLRSIDYGAVDWLTNYNYNIERLNETLLRVSNLANVDTSGIADGDVLQYESGTTTWKPASITDPPIDIYDWYVAPTGVDSSTAGQRTNPCKTIQYAVTYLASPGDSIGIYPGTYNEMVKITKQLTFKGISSGVLVTGGGVRACCFYSDNGADNVTIEGIGIAGARTGIFSWSDTGWTIRNCTVYDIYKTGVPTFKYNSTLDPGAQYCGIWMQSGSGHLIELNAISRLMREPDGYGVYIKQSSGCTVQDNQFYMIADAAVRIRQSGGSNVVQRNIALGCMVAEVNEGVGETVSNNYAYMARRGIQCKHSQAPYSTINHNTIRKAQFSGISFGGDPDTDTPLTDYVTAKWNHLWNCGNNDIYWKTSLNHFTIDYNLHQVSVPGITTRDAARTAGRRPLYYFYEGSDPETKKSYSIAQTRTLWPQFEAHSWDWGGSPPDSETYGAIGLPGQVIPNLVPLPNISVEAEGSNQYNGAGNLLEWNYYETPWRTAVGTTTAWIIFNLNNGVTASWRYVCFVNYEDNKPWAPKNFRLDTASSASGPWTEVYSGSNMDYGAQSLFYDCGTQSSKFVRLYLSGNHWPGSGTYAQTAYNYIRLACFMIFNMVAV